MSKQKPIINLMTITFFSRVNHTYSTLHREYIYPERSSRNERIRTNIVYIHTTYNICTYIIYMF